MKYTTDKKEIIEMQQLINDRLTAINWSIKDAIARKPLIYLGNVFKEYGEELEELEHEYTALNRLLKYNRIKWTAHYMVGDEKLGDTVKAEGRYDEINHYTSEAGRINACWNSKGGRSYQVDYIAATGKYCRCFNSLKAAKMFLIAEQPDQLIERGE